MAEDLIYLEKEIFGECGYSPDKISEIFSDGKNTAFIAYEEENPVGFICLMKVQTLHYSGIWIDLLGVLPAYRGRNIGKSLVDIANNYSLNQKVDILSALVKDSNTASKKVVISKEFDESDPFRLYIKDLTQAGG